MPESMVDQLVIISTAHVIKFGFMAHCLGRNYKCQVQKAWAMLNTKIKIAPSVDKAHFNQNFSNLSPCVKD